MPTADPPRPTLPPQPLAPNFPGRVLIFQPRPGLGDLIWHLPIIRAIAAATDTGQVTLLTKPSTQAEALLHADPAIDKIVWFDHNPRPHIGAAAPRKTPGRHGGVLGLPRLVAALRSCRADTAILLHHSAPLAAALRAAGIARRQAYGFSAAQRFWLSAGPFLPEPPPFTEAFDQASSFADALGFPALPEPAIAVSAEAIARVHSRLQALPRPWIVFGVGSNGSERQWGEAKFAALANGLLDRGAGSILLPVAAHEAPLAAHIALAVNRAKQTHSIVAWSLPDIAALLALADMFIGNDSGLMNLRAAIGKPAYALFGASGPLRHSANIRPIIPACGPRSGMANITVANVLQALPR